MSTEIINKVFPETLKILSDLIAFKTVSGEDNNSLINYCDDKLKALGAESFRIYDKEKKRVNLFATINTKSGNGLKGIILSGHTDVVPASKSWSTDPFKATLKDEKVFGRGTCDMKGFIACTLAIAPYFANQSMKRPIHFSFTFDEPKDDLFVIS